jgi:hypothetical protein
MEIAQNSFQEKEKIHLQANISLQVALEVNKSEGIPSLVIEMS